MPERSGLGNTLLLLARDAIGESFGLAPRSFADFPELKAPGATFVTLMRRGALRGCIGTLVAYRPLLEDVRENARRAAFNDPRFLPVAADELPTLKVEVSLLTPPTPLSFESEAEALTLLRPNIDGVVLNVRGRRATFLPQVWEDLPSPADFLSHLKQKAGLPPDFWDDDLELECYQVTKWKEEE